MARGEYWRLITSTFIHFSVIHLVLNLMAMYQLGTMVESWYGTPQFIFLYGMTAGGGNLVSVLIRHQIGLEPDGALGWWVGRDHGPGRALRGRRACGRGPRWVFRLGRIMVFFMVMTAVIGALLQQFIDNWGHAGGGLGGNRAGVRHRAFSGTRRKPVGLGTGSADGDRDCGVRRSPGRRRQTGGTCANRAKRTFAGWRARKKLSSAGSVGALGSPASRWYVHSEIAR